MSEAILTCNQVAKMLQIHPLTVLRYIKEGRLKGIKLGRVYRIRESEIEKFLQKNST